MASPAADMPNGISTPPTTANVNNPSPPAASSSSTQPNTQSQTHLPNGTAPAPAPTALPSHPPTSLQDDGKSKRPRDARLIHIILQNMGVHAYTERVPLQLLDFAYRYTQGILSDAIAYEPPTSQNTSGGNKRAKQDDEGVSLNAIRTAIASRAAAQFAPSLPKEFMADVAMERNRIALPRVEREFGLRLPPERYCFTGVGWGLKEAWEEEVDDEEDETMEGGAGGGGAGIGLGGPVGGGLGVPDAVMGGMEEEEVDQDEFEEVMGKDDVGMAE